MRINRYIAFPAAAATVWAQQATPGETEKALRTQVERYYQLMVAKKFREAEKMVAEESKEDYYNGTKPDVRGFSIASVNFTDNSYAVVTVLAKQVVLMMGAGAQIFELASPTYWKFEEGEWRWYIPERFKNMSPFGKMSSTVQGASASTMDMRGKAPGTLDAPDIAALQGQLKLSGNRITLTGEAPRQTVTISNGLPGPINLAFDPHVKTIKALSATIDKVHLESGEKATLTVIKIAQGPAFEDVTLIAEPLNVALQVTVEMR